MDMLRSPVKAEYFYFCHRLFVHFHFLRRVPGIWIQLPWTMPSKPPDSGAKPVTTWLDVATRWAWSPPATQCSAIMLTAVGLLDLQRCLGLSWRATAFSIPPHPSQAKQLLTQRPHTPKAKAKSKACAI
jgi:hypothetical protein